MKKLYPSVIAYILFLLLTAASLVLAVWLENNYVQVLFFFVALIIITVAHIFMIKFILNLDYNKKLIEILRKLNTKDFVEVSKLQNNAIALLFMEKFEITYFAKLTPKKDKILLLIKQNGEVMFEGPFYCTFQEFMNDFNFDK